MVLDDLVYLFQFQKQQKKVIVVSESSKVMYKIDLCKGVW